LGTFWETRLKIAGIKLTCLGVPPKDDSQTEKVFEKTDPEVFLCRKVIIENDKLKGAILLGPSDERYFSTHLGKSVNMQEIEQKLHEDPKKA
jgi:NAD(P)H-nitrite reductase large subunit